MIKVRILTGATVAASAIAFPTLVGCTADEPDAIESGDEANTASLAGSGNIALHGWSLHYGSTSGGDEFLRVGEKMNVTFDFNHVVTHFVAQGDAALAQTLAADPSLLKVELKLTYTKFDGSGFDVKVPVSWQPGASNITIGKSDEFVIPKQVKLLRVELVASYSQAGIPRTRELLESVPLRDFVVFGAFLPNKLAFFDSNGADRRTRIVEGGAAVRGANLLVSVSDWRLDGIVDKGSLDLRYGEVVSGNRFGPAIVPARGELVYEVEAAVSTDGGATWGAISLGKVDKPEVLARTDGFRFALQQGLAIPANAGNTLKIAFHVKAYLQVPGYAPGSVMNPRHAPHARVLLRDTWDNNAGQDYSLPIRGE